MPNLGLLGGLLSHTRYYVSTSIRPRLISADRIGALQTGARGQAAFSGDNMVDMVQLSLVVSQGGVVAHLASHLRTFVRGMCTLLYSFFFSLSVIFFVGGFPHHFVSI